MSDEMFDDSEVFLRSDAVVAEVNPRQRLVTLLAVPWDQTAVVPWLGEMWNEVFRRGSFDGLEEHAGRVRVNREHKVGKTVGRLVFVDPKAEDGLIAQAKIASTVLGEETLVLADEDMISPSVGYRIHKPEDLRVDRRGMVREVFRAFLDHLSLVEHPAFAGAQVLEVREEDTELTNVPDFARTLDAAWADPVYLEAVQRLKKVPSGN